MLTAICENLGWCFIHWHKFLVTLSLHFSLFLPLASWKTDKFSIQNENFFRHRKRFQIKIISHFIVLVGIEWEFLLFFCLLWFNPSTRLLDSVSISIWPNSFLICKFIRSDFEVTNNTKTIANNVCCSYIINLQWSSLFDQCKV